MVQRRFFLIFSTALVVTLTAGWWFRAPIKHWWGAQQQPFFVIGNAAPQPDAERYAVLKDEALRWRARLSNRYSVATNQAEREQVIDDATMFLETLLPDLMKCWLGTRWDFNGTSETPGEGAVACGYFVATVLRDAGFKVDRYGLAKQPSQNILRTFLPRREMKVQVGVGYDRYASELRGMTPGILIVGLDTHVGFLVVKDDSFRFIHSSGSRPWCVVDENQRQAKVLERSNYRVRGSLTGNREVIRRWLEADSWAVAGT